MAEIVRTPTPMVRTEVEELPRWRRRLRLTVASQHAATVRARYLREFGKRARMKGFRPGKAPAALVERQFGGEIERETLKDLIHEGYEAALRSESLDPVGPPEVSEVRWTPGGDLEFTAEVDVEPVLALSRTTGFRVERKVRRVSDDDADRVIERLRAERAEWRAVDREAAEGDRVVFDSVPLDEDGAPRDGERVANHRVELGTGEILPDFEAGLRGAKAGETRDLAVAFPDDHPNEALRGAARTYRVTVDSVLERVPPALDEAFARAVGDFESMDALRGKIRENLESEVEAQSRREVEEALIDEIIAANAIEIPDTLVERYLANMMSDREGPLEGRVPAERLEEVRAVLRPGAERALRRYYILRRIAESEGLGTDDAELDAAIAERIDPETTSPAEARRRLERAGDLDDLRFHLTMEKVFDWLRARSTIEPVEA